MTSCALPPSAYPHDDYRRQARRIRGTFANAPHLRARALRDLAHRYDRRGAAETLQRTGSLPAQPAATFAAMVRERMDGPVLRYSHRAALIRTAERSGIGRFEANLIIAAIQHEAAESRVAKPFDRRSGTWVSWVPVAIAVIATQTAIMLGVWAVIR